jgi:hypothetical protein
LTDQQYIGQEPGYGRSVLGGISRKTPQPKLLQKRVDPTMNNPADDNLIGLSASLGKEKAKEKEFEYMLQEVGQASRLIGERQMRLDRIISYFLPILAVVIAYGVVAAITASSEHVASILGVSTFLVAIIGFLAVLSMSAIIAEIVSGLGDYYLRRQYFIDAFPDAAKQYLNPRSGQQIQELWRTGFNFFAVCLLTTLAIFNSIFFTLSLSALSFLFKGTPVQSFEQILIFDVTPPAIYSALVVFAIAFIGQMFVMWRYVTGSKKHLNKISILLLGPTAETSEPEGQTGTSQ